ncbi:MAG: GldG family protein [Gammaproteobacteria bacterium]|nr:GldG family protein [Gammaproteobacteria bacterium]
MLIDKHTRRTLKLQGLLGGMLTLAILLLAIWLTGSSRSAIDVTATKRHSLSEASIELLSTLDGPLTITAFMREQATLRRHLEELVDRYRDVHADITLTFVNPDTAPELARKEGIRNVPELVLRHGDDRAQVRSLAEADISNAIATMSRRGDRWVAFMQGHGERNWQGNGGFDMGTFVAALGKQGFRLQGINLAEQSLPRNVELLVVASPVDDWLPIEIERTRRFLDDGGQLLWLTDPGDGPELGYLQAMLGVRLQPGTIVDAEARVFGITDPTIAVITQYPQLGPTRAFDKNTAFLRATGITSREGSNWKLTPILQTSPQSWLERSPIGDSVSLDDTDLPGPITFGVMLERPVLADGGREARGSQRAVVIGDGDFLSNRMIGNGGNLALGLNLFNWLTAEDQLLNIDITARPDRNLDLGQASLLAIAVLFLFVIPLALFGAGVFRFVQRRRG